MNQTILYIFAAFIVIYLITIFVYIGETKKNRTNVAISPNMKYTIGDYDYKVPNLNVKGSAYLLEEQFLISMTAMYKLASKSFEEIDAEFWASGGTLMGFQRHRSFLPWDDDLDVHSDVKNKEILYSDKFKKILNKNGLDTLFMIGTRKDFTFYKGGLRIKFLDKPNPVMDVFFVDVTKNKVKKIENWLGEEYIYNQNEIWKKDLIFPIQKLQINDMEVNMPNNPHEVLSKQYSPNYKDEIHCGYPAHTAAYDLCSFIWKKQAD